MKNIFYFYRFFRAYKHGRLKSLYKALKLHLGQRVLLMRGW